MEIVECFCGNKLGVNKGQWVICEKCGTSVTHKPLKEKKAPGSKVPCGDGLSDRAALYLEELHISGDTMIEMDHSLESLDDDKVGALYLHDILAGFVESEVGR